MKRLAVLLLPILLSSLAAAAPPATQPTLPPFLLGADISWLPEDEADGATYYDHDRQKDLLQLLKDHGFNAVRLRLFVNPQAPNGYAARRTEPFCDLQHTLAMARRVKQAGLTLFLDFHYSDTWADPGKQYTPAAWRDDSLDQLEQHVYEHTRQALLALQSQNATPELVQIGNEISNGMLWPTGSLKNLDDFAQLVQSGINATRSVDPKIKIALHHDKGRTSPAVQWWLDNLIARHVTDFDLIALSCYQQAREGDWERTFQDLNRKYPQYQLLVAEYSARKRSVNDLAHQHHAAGTFIWEPTRHKEAIFDHNGRNAGGGEPNAYLSTAPAARPATTRPTRRPTTRRSTPFTHGGRYDANPYLDVYPQLAHDYHLTP